MIRPNAFIVTQQCLPIALNPSEISSKFVQGEHSNRSNIVLVISEGSTGGVSGTVADSKLIYLDALRANKSGIILHLLCVCFYYINRRFQLL